MPLKYDILSYIINNITGTYPLLNTKWKQLKSFSKGTNKSSVEYPFVGCVNNIIKLRLKEVPNKKIKKSLYLSKWNIYLEVRNKKRNVIYLTKDILSNNDIYLGYKLSDKIIYKSDNENFLKDKPVFVLAAKKNTKLENDILDDLNDILLEIKDEISSSNIKIKINENISHIEINIEFDTPIEYSEKLNILIKNIYNRIIYYLSHKNKEYNNNIIHYKIKEPFYYKGTKGRFGLEIIPEAIKFTQKYYSIPYLNLWDFNHNFLNIGNFKNIFFENYKYKKLALKDSDIDTLLSDLENCSINPPINNKSDHDFSNNNKIKKIKIIGVLFLFNK